MTPDLRFRTRPTAWATTLWAVLALALTAQALLAPALALTARALLSPAPGTPAHADRGALPAARFTWPLAPPPLVARPFEPPQSPYGPGHRGVDLPGTPGQPVLSAGDGVVVFAGQVAGRGVVSVDHDPDLRTTYEPVATPVPTGARVHRGDPVATLLPGHDGCPGAPACLHWGLRRGTDYLDPLLLVRPTGVRLLPLTASNPPPEPHPAAPAPAPHHPGPSPTPLSPPAPRSHLESPSPESPSRAPPPHEHERLRWQPAHSDRRPPTQPFGRDRVASGTSTATHPPTTATSSPAPARSPNLNPTARTRTTGFALAWGPAGACACPLGIRRPDSDPGTSSSQDPPTSVRPLPASTLPGVPALDHPRARPTSQRSTHRSRPHDDVLPRRRRRDRRQRPCSRPGRPDQPTPPSVSWAPPGRINGGPGPAHPIRTAVPTG